jgi:hypothetical protein
MTALADSVLQSIDVSKMTYPLIQPPETLPPIYPKLEPVAAPAPPSQPVDPVVLQQYYLQQYQQQQQLAAEAAAAERRHRKKKKKRGVLERLQDGAASIKSRLEAFVPEFVGLEDYDDESDEEEAYEAASVDRSMPHTQPFNVGMQGEFSYGTRPGVKATAPPMDSSSSSSGPPSFYAEPSTYAPPLSAGLFQKINSRHSAVKLRAEGVTVADLIAADVKLVDFRRAGYTLDEVHHLVPEYEFLLKLGADRALFDNKWRISALCELYKLPYSSVCQTLKLNADDLLRAGLGLDELGKTQLSLGQLIRLGAGFDFIRALRSPPYRVSARLKATHEDLDALNFTRDQKLQLQKEFGWSSTAMIGSFGITAASVSQDWLPLNMESILSGSHW